MLASDAGAAAGGAAAGGAAAASALPLQLKPGPETEYRYLSSHGSTTTLKLSDYINTIPKWPGGLVIRYKLRGGQGVSVPTSTRTPNRRISSETSFNAEDYLDYLKIYVDDEGAYSVTLFVRGEGHIAWEVNKELPHAERFPSEKHPWDIEIPLIRYSYEEQSFNTGVLKLADYGPGTGILPVNLGYDASGPTVGQEFFLNSRSYHWDNESKTWERFEPRLLGSKFTYVRDHPQYKRGVGTFPLIIVSSTEPKEYITGESSIRPVLHPGPMPMRGGVGHFVRGDIKDNSLLHLLMRGSSPEKIAEWCADREKYAPLPGLNADTKVLEVYGSHCLNPRPDPSLGSACTVTQFMEDFGPWFGFFGGDLLDAAKLEDTHIRTNIRTETSELTELVECLRQIEENPTDPSNPAYSNRLICEIMCDNHVKEPWTDPERSIMVVKKDIQWIQDNIGDLEEQLRVMKLQIDAMKEVKRLGNPELVGRSEGGGPTTRKKHKTGNKGGGYRERLTRRTRKSRRTRRTRRTRKSRKRRKTRKRRAKTRGSR